MARFSRSNQRLNGLNPLAYIGDNSYQPPEFVTDNRPPTSTDAQNFELGTIWLDVSTNVPPEAENIWMLVALLGGVATWVNFSSGAEATQFDADVGTAIPANNIINILGSGGIGTSAAGNTIIINGTGGSTALVTKFDSAGSFVWNKDPRTTWVTIYALHGGCGGASGRRGLSGQSGGGGGGEGGKGFTYDGPSEFFPDTATVIVGAGGVGAASQTIDNTDGNPGNVGGTSSFGDLSVFPNTPYPWTNPPPSNAGSGGRNGFAGPVRNINVPFNHFGSFTGITTVGSGIIGGAGNGTVTDGSSPDNSGNIWGSPSVFPTGAVPPALSGLGGGGGAGADSAIERVGGTALTTYRVPALTLLLAGGQGGTESLIIDGTDGADSDPAIKIGYLSGGTGGGGGGGQFVGLAAGNGGDGGIPGGGGGGGGGSLNGTNSGAGGNGSRGEVWVIEKF